MAAPLVQILPFPPPSRQPVEPARKPAWLKDNKVDLALGVMINAGTQPTIKEATRLGMGPDLEYPITFGFAMPAHLQIFVPAMGETGNGVVVAGDIDLDAARKLVEKWFGEVPKGADVMPIAPPAARLTSVKRQTMTDRVRLPRLYLAWLSPKMFAPGAAGADSRGSIRDSRAVPPPRADPGRAHRRDPGRAGLHAG